MTTQITDAQSEQPTTYGKKFAKEKQPGLVLRRDMMKALNYLPGEQFKVLVNAMFNYCDALGRRSIDSLQTSHSIADSIADSTADSPAFEDAILYPLFESFRERIEYDCGSFIEYRERQRENARKRWEKEKEKEKQQQESDAVPNDATQCDAMPNDATQCDAMPIELNRIELNRNELNRNNCTTSSSGQSPRTPVQEKVVGKPYCIEEVEEYAKELSTAEKLSGRPNNYYGKNIKQYAEEFYDYWESAGWKRRGGAIKDWKASFRNWCSNEFKKPTKYSNHNNQSDTVRYVLSTNVDSGDAYKDPNAFGTLLNNIRAERERNNNN